MSRPCIGILILVLFALMEAAQALPDRPSLYGAPVFGVASVFGDPGASPLSGVFLGGRLGVVWSRRVRIQADYVYLEESFSNPRIPSLAQSGIPDMGPAFQMKTTQIAFGAKLFSGDPDSRIRAYLGGGAFWSRGALSYSPIYQQVLGMQTRYGSDYQMDLWGGYGEFGAEISLVRSLVADLGIQLSSPINAGGTRAGGGQDPSKWEVGNSLSRSIGYRISAGLGIYF